MAVPIPAPRLCEAGGGLRGRGAPMDGSGWWSGAGRSWESDVLIPRPVVWRGLPLGLVGELVNLDQASIQQLSNICSLYIKYDF